MSIKSEIDRISAAVAAAYDVLEELGAAMPEVRNVENLASTIKFFKSSSSSWTDPEVSGTSLYVQSVYNATKDESTLYVE